MTHTNLILTEEAIKAHCKRLQKELKFLSQDIPLTQVQKIFSKSLGFNNFQELKKVLIIEKSKVNRDNNEDILFEQLIENSKNQLKINEIFINACKNGNIKIVSLLFENKLIVNKPNKAAKDEHGNKHGAIYQACLSGNLTLIKYLVEKLDIPFKDNAFLFFYCRSGDVFKYMVLQLTKEIEIKEYRDKLKSTLLNNCFYDYDVFQEIIKMKLFDKNELNKLLPNTINPFCYKTKEEISNKNKIISSLIGMGYDMCLYKEDNNIFLEIMYKINCYEKDIPRASEYYTEKVIAMKKILQYLDQKYNYLSSVYVSEVIKYFKNNPDSLHQEYKGYNNSYIQELIKS